MNYHLDAQAGAGRSRRAPSAEPTKSGISRPITARCAPTATTSQLNGNVHVTGPAPGGGEPLSLTTEIMRINTPTEFIETDAPVQTALVGT